MSAVTTTTTIINEQTMKSVEEVNSALFPHWYNSRVTEVEIDLHKGRHVYKCFMEVSSGKGKIIDIFYVNLCDAEEYIYQTYINDFDISQYTGINEHGLTVDDLWEDVTETYQFRTLEAYDYLSQLHRKAIEEATSKASIL